MDAETEQPGGEQPMFLRLHRIHIHEAAARLPWLQLQPQLLDGARRQNKHASRVHLETEWGGVKKAKR